MNDFDKQIYLSEVSNLDESEIKNKIRNKICEKVYSFSKKTYFRFIGAAIGAMTLVWWCVLYPELCFPRDTYEAVYETQKDDVVETEDRNMESGTEISGVYPEILQADDEQIVIKSRLFEWLSNKID